MRRPRRRARAVSAAALAALAAGGLAAGASAPPDVDVIELATSPALSSASHPQLAPEVGQRIFGGRDAVDGEFPFNVLVEVTYAGGSIGCSGSVVAQGWVLSAAHCVADDNGNFLPEISGIDVTAGVTDLNDATAANAFPVSTAVVSNDYNPSINGFANDWSLLRLGSAPPVEGLPLARAEQTAFGAPGNVGWISGYGLDGESPPVLPSRLNVGSAPILTDSDCTSYFGGAYAPGLMNCTGPPFGGTPVDATTCPGDSGGPLFVPFGTGYLQSGVTSFGPAPCELERTGGYTKVSSYTAFLAEQMSARDASLGAPRATTGPVVATHDDGLTVQGQIDPNEVATNVQVEWGTTPALGEGFVRGYAGIDANSVPVSARLTGAPPSTTIHYRVSAINALGVADGDVQTGRTGGAANPPQTPSGGGSTPPPTGGTQQPTATAPPACAGQPATIVGTDAGEVLTGTAGADVIVGLGGNDVIVGLAGDDLICPDGGADQVDAGAGDDRVLASAGADAIRGNAGSDAVAGGAGADDVRGGPGADRVTGGAGDDRLRGGSGDDSLVGGTGNDFLRADAGGDLLFGDTGADRLIGDRGNDVLRGGPGRDQIFGGEGADLALGKASNDRVFGGPGNDRLFGNEGNDRLVGRGGRDSGFGGRGRDVCDTEVQSSC